MVETIDRAVIGDRATAAAPPMAVAGIIVSTTLVAVGNGLVFGYIPVRLGAEGFAPTWAGSILTGLSAGGIAGCLLTGRLLNRIGHARAYLVLSALIVLSNVAVAAGPDPVAWIAARALYGFAICALFIVAQSWLNDAVDNAIRGRVMATFYVAYVVGLGAGYFLLRFVDLRSPEAPLIGIAFAALSMLPVGMTRLRPPPPAATLSLALGRAWRISPVGMAGMLAVGAISMMIAGFTPIHATARGYSQAEVATLMSMLPIGTLMFQVPFGWVSDRTDRRYVLIAASVVVVLAGLAAMCFDGGALPLIIAIYLVWSGAADSIYSVANAHANDRAGKDDMVALSSSMVLAWSIAGFVAPGVGTVLTGLYGTASFMYLAIGTAAAYIAFVAWRVCAVPPAEPSGPPVAPISAQAPLPLESSGKDG